MNYTPGDRVLVRGEILRYEPGIGALVEFFSKTDQWAGWVREDLLSSGVVLDLDDAAHCLTALWLAESQEQSVTARLLLRSVIGKIEAQTKPPRIPEPGLWGVVQAAIPGGRIQSKWVRMLDGGPDEHWGNDEGDWSSWDDLIDPVLIRPGIEDES